MSKKFKYAYWKQNELQFWDLIAQDSDRSEEFILASCWRTLSKSLRWHIEWFGMGESISAYKTQKEAKEAAKSLAESEGFKIVDYKWIAMK